ncbi:DNA-directed RNA polymerase II core subunit rpb9 [Chytriomyces hyalinus]|nr:DNA-directed RNA polymerase II core subunit rpb9 [Chytriomyces hyalinus]
MSNNKVETPLDHSKTYFHTFKGLNLVLTSSHTTTVTLEKAAGQHKKPKKLSCGQNVASLSSPIHSWLRSIKCLASVVKNSIDGFTVCQVHLDCRNAAKAQLAATEEGRKRRSDSAHRSAEKAARLSKDVIVTKPHVEMFGEADTVASIRKLVKPHIVTCLKSSMDFIYCDVEPTRDGRKNTHADTAMWAFFSMQQLQWLSITRNSSIPNSYWLCVGQDKAAKKQASDRECLLAIEDFVGNSKKSALNQMFKLITAARILVFFASYNAHDKNRILDWFTTHNHPQQLQWFNAGADLLFPIFGIKHEPILSENKKLETIYSQFWKVDGQDPKSGVIDYESNTLLKEAVSPIHKHKYLQMSKILFCTDCSNMLYPKEDSDSKMLTYACRHCSKSYGIDAEHHCVHRNQIKANPIAQTLARVDLSSDPTYPRLQKECPQCGFDEAVFFLSKAKATDTTMQLYFACCSNVCGYRWTVPTEAQNE